MHRGYIKLWRKTLDSGIVQDGPMSQFFLKAILETAYTTTHKMISGERITLEPGEFVYGRQAWARDLGLSEKVVRVRAENGQKMGLIKATKMASKYTIFKFVNWEIYQQDTDQPGPALGPAKGPEQGQQRASKGPHLKEGKKVRKEQEETSYEVSCAEPEVSGSTPQSPVDPLVCTLPLNDGTDFNVTRSYVNEIQPLYPAVDVIQALRSMKGWLLADPTRRKTMRGVRKFIANWLDRDQNRGGSRPAGSNGTGKPSPRTYSEAHVQLRGSVASKILEDMKNGKHEGGQHGVGQVPGPAQLTQGAG